MAKTTVQATTELGRQLEKERINRDLTIDAWCVELEVSRQQYLQWRTRPVELALVNLRRVAVVMGVTLDTVFGWVDVEVPIIHVIPWFTRPIDATAREGILAAA